MSNAPMTLRRFPPYTHVCRCCWRRLAPDALKITCRVCHQLACPYCHARQETCRSCWPLPDLTALDFPDILARVSTALQLNDGIVRNVSVKLPDRLVDATIWIHHYGPRGHWTSPPDSPFPIGCYVRHESPGNSAGVITIETRRDDAAACIEASVWLWLHRQILDPQYYGDYQWGSASSSPP